MRRDVFWAQKLKSYSGFNFKLLKPRTNFLLEKHAICNKFLSSTGCLIMYHIVTVSSSSTVKPGNKKLPSKYNLSLVNFFYSKNSHLAQALVNFFATP